MFWIVFNNSSGFRRNLGCSPSPVASWPGWRSTLQCLWTWTPSEAASKVLINCPWRSWCSRWFSQHLASSASPHAISVWPLDKKKSKKNVWDTCKKFVDISCIDDVCMPTGVTILNSISSPNVAEAAHHASSWYTQVVKNPVFTNAAGAASNAIHGDGGHPAHGHPGHAAPHHGRRLFDFTNPFGSGAQGEDETGEPRCSDENGPVEKDMTCTLRSHKLYRRHPISEFVRLCWTTFLHPQYLAWLEG